MAVRMTHGEKNLDSAFTNSIKVEEHTSDLLLSFINDVNTFPLFSIKT